LVLLPHMAQTQYARDSSRVPRFKFVEMQNHTVRVGSEATFACIVEHLGGYKVAWLHSEKGTLAVYPNVITQNDRISLKHDNRYAYYLHLRDIQESDAGKYICQLNTDPAISIGGGLNVVVPPDIIDEDSSSDTLATEGMPVGLVCKARGNPRTQIAWRREDGKPIRLCHPQDTNGPVIHNTGRSRNGNGKKHRPKSHQTQDRDCREVMVHYGSALALPHVSRHDSGVYFCLASNGVPPTVSKKVRLYVDFPPTLWITHQLIGASEGDSAKLECLTAAHPPSLNFWTRDGGKSYIIPTPGKYDTELIEGKPAFYNIRMKLSIHNVSAADFGTYRCMAKNSQGQTTGDIEIYELPKPSTTTLAYMEDYDITPQSKEVPKNLTQVVFANEDYSNVPNKNKNNVNRGRFPEEYDRAGNGSKRKHFKQSRSQTKSESDLKSFHQNGDSNSPFDKRFGSNTGSSTCQKSFNRVILLMFIFGSGLYKNILLSRMA